MLVWGTREQAQEKRSLITALKPLSSWGFWEENLRKALAY